jgi:hypothetical protein
MENRTLALIAVSAATLSMATGGASAPATRLATFRPSLGWLAVRAGVDNPSLVVAVTARDAAAVHPVALFGGFTRLSRGGILVWADTVGRGRRDFPAASAWPPHLASFRIDHGWEGQPAANIQQRTWVGSVDRWDLDVRVFFATQRPGRALQARAQAELNRLRLP